MNAIVITGERSYLTKKCELSLAVVFHENFLEDASYKLCNLEIKKLF